MQEVAERIDISFNLSIYSLLEPPQTPFERPRKSERQHAYPGQVLTTYASSIHSLPRYQQCRAISCMTVPNNILKQGGAEVVVSLVLRGAPFQFMQQRLMKPNRLIKRRKQLCRHKAWLYEAGIACSLLVRGRGRWFGRMKSLLAPQRLVRFRRLPHVCRMTDLDIFLA